MRPEPSPALTVAAIVPARNAAATLGATLAALKDQTYPISETIVFDDASDDETSQMARAAGATVMTGHSVPVGPGGGRNAAAARTDAQLLLFVDADVRLEPTALERLVRTLVETNASACFGSYDDNPSVRRSSSLYANLRHHHHHQKAQPVATTFWAGIGLIRRQMFVRTGGFDTRRYALPSIEDIELGTRILRAGGTIRVVPDARGMHAKDWTVRRLWRTDILQRAFPWSLLILDGGLPQGDLNLRRMERLSALVALLFLTCLTLGLFFPILLLGAAAAIAVYMGINRDFFSLLLRKGGWRGLLVGVSLHICYHVYASATYALVYAGLRLRLIEPTSRGDDGRLKSRSHEIGMSAEEAAFPSASPARAPSSGDAPDLSEKTEVSR